MRYMQRLNNDQKTYESLHVYLLPLKNIQPTMCIDACWWRTPKHDFLKVAPRVHVHTMPKCVFSVGEYVFTICKVLQVQITISHEKSCSDCVDMS